MQIKKKLITILGQVTSYHGLPQPLQPSSGIYLISGYDRFLTHYFPFAIIQ
jgi:hypothetical protein